MTRARRLLWRSSAGSAAGLLLLGVVSLDRVDHRPYFGEPWYAETTARLRAHQTTNAHESGRVKGFHRGGEAGN
jgi:hypothetical protein